MSNRLFGTLSSVGRVIDDLPLVSNVRCMLDFLDSLIFCGPYILGNVGGPDVLEDHQLTITVLE